MERTTRLYQHIGELFYAVAMVDQVVRDAEVESLKSLISKEWVTHEPSEDAHHSNAAFQIEYVFDYLNDTASPSEQWFEDFKLFKKLNEDLFDTDLKQRIIRTANAIASSYAGTNKSELDLLLKLELLLK